MKRVRVIVFKGKEMTGWWEKNKGSVGGKEKQVYAEKRRKHEEESQRKRRCGNTRESSISKERPGSWWGMVSKLQA